MFFLPLCVITFNLNRSLLLLFIANNLRLLLWRNFLLFYLSLLYSNYLSFWAWSWAFFVIKFFFELSKFLFFIFDQLRPFVSITIEPWWLFQSIPLWSLLDFFDLLLTNENSVWSSFSSLIDPFSLIMTFLSRFSFRRVCWLYWFL
jgi:hypothetical protein